jgi:exodeoxyribonuclease VII large subunit
VTGPLDLFAAAEAERLTREWAERPGGADDPGGGEPRVAYGVAALNRLVRELLDASLPPMWVAGEVSNWKRSARGHCYFSLRDAEAQVRCVLFAADARRLPAEPEEGMSVRALGTVTLYEARGEYQLVVRELEASAAGGLWRVAFERLRAQLEAEGLLDPGRKRPLPPTPRRVGVVTSPVGAAIHDILRVIEQRAPWTTVVLSPARVQGEGAEHEIARALENLVTYGRVDVVIVGRGGGSVEDLWAFNRAEVARAIAECPVPVVSAVGHETDVTIADLVADRRAATPSSAAELVVPDGAELRRHVRVCAARLSGGLRRASDRKRRAVEALAASLGSRARSLLQSREHRLGRVADRLEALSPLASLKRGYTVAQDPTGRLLRRVEDFEPGRPFRLRLVDGRVHCHVERTESDG